MQINNMNKDNYLKIKELGRRIISCISSIYPVFQEWKTDVWERDLDDDDCCDGRECGCEGRTVRQNYKWDIENS